MKQKELRLGIIGLSPGNGHPYSWSAIFNGYNEQAMAKCPFPVIPEYLDRQSFPEDQIQGASVTHIWTQDLDVSKDVAKAALIPNIVEHPAELIGKVDAILLARDDAEHHYEMAKPFIEVGLPIYIDKPLAFDLDTAQNILDLQQYEGQVFSCSALSYAPELQITDEMKDMLGNITRIEAQVIKDWKKYAIHIIDPVLNMFDWQVGIDTINTTTDKKAHTTEVTWRNKLTTSFTTLGKNVQAPITITVYGEYNDYKPVTLRFVDTYAAFKNALQRFLDIVNKKERPIDSNRILVPIEIIERGMNEG